MIIFQVEKTKYHTLAVIWLFHPFQIKLQNPSNKPVLYQAVVAGDGSRDFILPQGNYIQVSTHNFIACDGEKSLHKFQILFFHENSKKILME